MIDKTDLLQ